MSIGSPIYDAKTLLAYYIIVVFKGDLEKLVAIAEASEQKDIEKHKESAALHEPRKPSLTPPAQTVSSVLPYTGTPQEVLRLANANNPDFFYPFDKDTARCTIPMAMSLIATAEFIGSLLTVPYKWKPDINLEHFFAASDFTISPEERKMLRVVFRNSIMHSFFPKANAIGIAYDSSYDDTKLFIESGSSIILNVKYFMKVVKSTVEKLFLDTSRHEKIEQAFGEYLDANRTESDTTITEFKMRVV